MKETKSNRIRVIRCRLTPEEYTSLEKKWSSSTCRKLSDFIRKVVFEKPLLTNYRNQSMDELMTELSLLRRELNHIGNNFNQSVKRLHTLNQITEFRSWLMSHEVTKSTLANKLEEIKKVIQKIAESWYQGSK